MNFLLVANLRHYWRRYVATGVAVIIAVMFIVAVLVLGDAVNDSMARDLFGKYQGSAAVVTQSADGEPASTEEVLDKLDSVPEIDAVGVLVTRYGELDGGSGGSVVARLEEPFQNPTLVEGQLPNEPGQVVLNDNSGWQIGDIVTLTPYGDGDPTAFTVVGLTDRTDSGALLTLADVTSLFGGENGLYAEGYLLAAAPGVTEEQVARAATAALAGTDFAAITTPAQINMDLEEMRVSTVQLTAVFMVFPAIAVVMAVVVISTTFQVLMQQRRREIGLMRCVGATAKQVRRYLVGESLLVGAAASALGVIFGVLFAALAAVILHLFPSFGHGLTAISFGPLLAVFLGGTLITLLAGLRPASKVSQLPPLVTLQDSQVENIGRGTGWWVRLILGSLVAVGATAGMLKAAFATSGNSTNSEVRLLIAIGLGPVALAGIALAMASAFPPIQGWVGKLWRGTGGKLAAANAQRTPGRTAATGVSMLVGVTLITTMLVGAASVRHAVNAELDSRMATDLIVTGQNLTEEDAQIIGEVPGIKAAATERGTAPTYLIDDSPVSLYDTGAMQHVARTDFGKLEANQIQLSPLFGHADGETVTVCLEDTCQDFEVVLDASWTGNADRAGVSPETFATLSAGQEVSIERMLAQLKNISDYDAVSKDISAINADWTLDGAAPWRAQFDQIINLLLTGVTALLAVSVLVALVGVSNTLSLSVAERTRELGLLRALGMTRKQVGRLLSIEAAQTALTAGVLGILAGVLFGWIGTVAVFADLGETSLVVPWLQLGLVLLVAVGASIVASWMPGRRAGKTSPVEALAVA